LTRLFKEQFGCTPAAYRKNPVPVPLQNFKTVLFPDYDEKRIKTMEESRMNVRVEFIPAHKYMGIWEETLIELEDS
jgi:AraC-like DNA-binding protein